MTDNRAEIPAKYKWDLMKIYPDMETFDSDFAKAKEIIDHFPAHEKTMCESAEGLLSMLKDNLACERLISKLFQFAHLSSDLDKSDNTYLALMGRMINLANTAGAASYFVSPALIPSR